MSTSLRIFLHNAPLLLVGIAFLFGANNMHLMLAGLAAVLYGAIGYDVGNLALYLHDLETDFTKRLDKLDTALRELALLNQEGAR